MKLHKVGVKLVQSCYKLGAEKLQKMAQKHQKTYQLVGKNLEKTCEKLGKNLELLKDFEWIWSKFRVDLEQKNSTYYMICGITL